MKKGIEYLDADEALQILKSNQSVFIHSAAATPKLLVDALTKRGDEVTNINVYSIHTEYGTVFL